MGGGGGGGGGIWRYARVTKANMFDAESGQWLNELVYAPKEGIKSKWHRMRGVPYYVCDGIAPAVAKCEGLVQLATTLAEQARVHEVAAAMPAGGGGGGGAGGWGGGGATRWRAGRWRCKRTRTRSNACSRPRHTRGTRDDG